MKVKVTYCYTGILGQEGTGETIMELPDTNFAAQFAEFRRHMKDLAKDNNYYDLYDTSVEMVEE